MPRGAPSKADTALVEYLAGQGLEISPYQLERWRLAGLLPRPVRRGLGRGTGSVSAYPEGADTCAHILALAIRQGRSVHHGALSLYACWLPLDDKALRKALCWVLERHHQLLARAAERYGDPGEVADRAARRVTVYEPELLTAYFPDLLNENAVIPRAAADRRAKKRKDLREAFFTATLAAVDPKEVPDDMQIDFMEQVGWTEEAASLRKDMFAAARAGELFGTADPDFPDFPSLVDVARSAPAEKLAEARDIVRVCGAVNWLLHLSSTIDRQAWELFTSLREEPASALARSASACPPHLASRIVQPVLSLIACDDLNNRSDGLPTVTAARDYGNSLLPDALRAYARATRAVESKFGEDNPVTPEVLDKLDGLADGIAEAPVGSEAHIVRTRYAIYLADLWFVQLGEAVA